MTAVRRIAIALPIVLAAVALVYALKPFSLTGGTLTDASGHRFVALTSASSCGVPIVAAWRGKDDVFAVPVGTKPANPSVPQYLLGPSTNVKVTESIRIPTCRGEARHRLRVAGLLLVTSIALGL